MHICGCVWKKYHGSKFVVKSNLDMVEIFNWSKIKKFLKVIKCVNIKRILFNFKNLNQKLRNEHNFGLTTI
jgi:hypothetical protein